jgi:PKHD-type hydroxylase
MFLSYNFDQKENDSQNYYFYKEGFNKEELNNIYKGIQLLKEQKASTVGGGKDDVRSSKVRWIPQDANWWWLYEKLSSMVVEANKTLWDFDLHHIPEAIQYTEYYATEKGHYTWHQDIGPGILSKRKISITVQLSDPSEYEGGNLQLWQGGNYEDNTFITAYKGAGSVFIFPSYMMHRVTGVTKGVRRSFVLWVGGSHYR